MDEEDEIVGGYLDEGGLFLWHALSECWWIFYIKPKGTLQGVGVPSDKFVRSTMIAQIMEKLPRRHKPGMQAVRGGGRFRAREGRGIQGSGARDIVYGRRRRPREETTGRHGKK